MPDDLDLSGVHGRHEPDPVFRQDLRRQVEAIVRAPALPTLAAHEVAVPDLEVEELIMLETQERPTGDGPGTSHRSRRRWLLVAAAASVVAVVGALVVAAGDDDERLHTVASTPTTTPPRNMLELQEGTITLEPGRYFIDPDGDSTPLRVTFEVMEGWSPWLGVLKFWEGGHTSFSITTVTNLVTDGCTGHHPRVPAVGPTVDDLATALSQLPPFQVTAPPTDVTLFGYQGKHLKLTVPDLRVTGESDNRRFADCVEGELRSWISPLGLGGSFWGYLGRPGITEEFWILDVHGTRLVLVKLDSPGTSAQDVAERDAMFNSISIEP